MLPPLRFLVYPGSAHRPILENPGIFLAGTRLMKPCNRDDHLQRVYDVSYIGNLGKPPCKAMLWPYLDRLSCRGRKALICTERPMGPPLMP